MVISNDSNSIQLIPFPPTTVNLIFKYFPCFRLKNLFPDISDVKDISVKLSFQGDLQFPSEGTNRNISAWADSSTIAEYINGNDETIPYEDLPNSFPGFCIRAAVCPVQEDRLWVYLQLHPQSLDRLTTMANQKGVEVNSTSIPTTHIRCGKDVAREMMFAPLEKVS